MDDRMTIANMAIEAGGKNGIFEFDAKTEEQVNYRTRLNNTKTAYSPVPRDRDEKFVYELVVELDKLEPTVACHPDPGQRKKAKNQPSAHRLHRTALAERRATFGSRAWCGRRDHRRAFRDPGNRP
jgi:homoaconitase/3-isopropylmalate dehydratase large subunit